MKIQFKNTVVAISSSFGLSIFLLSFISGVSAIVEVGYPFSGKIWDAYLNNFNIKRPVFIILWLIAFLVFMILLNRAKRKTAAD